MYRAIEIRKSHGKDHGGVKEEVGFKADYTEINGDIWCRHWRIRGFHKVERRVRASRQKEQHEQKHPCLTAHWKFGELWVVQRMYGKARKTDWTQNGKIPKCQTKKKCRLDPTVNGSQQRNFKANMWLNDTCIIEKKKETDSSAENWSEMREDYREKDKYNDLGKKR